MREGIICAERWSWKIMKRSWRSHGKIFAKFVGTLSIVGGYFSLFPIIFLELQVFIIKSKKTFILGQVSVFLQPYIYVLFPRADTWPDTWVDTPPRLVSYTQVRDSTGIIRYMYLLSARSPFLSCTCCTSGRLPGHGRLFLAWCSSGS